MLLTSRNIANGEEPHSDVPIHCPFLRLQVGLTAVVHETGVVALGSCIDDAILVHSQHVEVCDVVFMCLLDATLALLFVNQVAHILIDKLALRKSSDVMQKT